MTVLGANVSQGGDGGIGADGGAVAVTPSGQVRTIGHQSAAITAHSIGGGGGSSSTTVNASIGVLDANVSTGGSGGVGGDGDTVSIDAPGVLVTNGHNQGAIKASSIGGGDSGTTVTETVSGGSVDVTVGGAGGSSGSAAAVDVTAAARISTRGRHSTGIHAQSVANSGGRRAM